MLALLFVFLCVSLRSLISSSWDRSAYICMQLSQPQGYFLVFSLSMALSCLWAPDPLESLSRAGLLVIYFGTIVVIAALLHCQGRGAAFDAAKQIRVLILGALGFRLVLMWLCAIVSRETVLLFPNTQPGFSIPQPAYDGWGALQHNAAGFFSLVILLALSIAWSTVPKASARIVMLCGMVGAVSSLALSYSRSAQVTLLVVPLIWILSMLKWKSRSVLLLFVAAVSLLMAQPLLAYLARDKSILDGTFLKGRELFWSSAVKAIQNAPLLGYGYYSGEREALRAFGDFGEHAHISLAHNSFFTAQLSAGILGSLPLLVGVVVMLRRTSGAVQSIAPAPGSVETRVLRLQSWAIAVVITLLMQVGSVYLVFPNLMRNLPLVIVVAYIASLDCNVASSRKQVVAS